MTDGTYKLRDVMDKLDPLELIKLKKDLDLGGIHLKKFVNKQIKENEKNHEKYCSVCMGKIDLTNISTYTLMFGPADFKKKATFCAMDCLKYFIQNLEQLKAKKIKVQENPAMTS